MKLHIAILLALIYACTMNAQLTVKGHITVKNETDSIHEIAINNIMMGNSSYTPVKADNNQFNIKLTSANNGFYQLNIIVRKGDSNKYPFNIPLYMPDSIRIYNLDIQIDNEKIQYGFDNDNTFLGEYYNQANVMNKEVWTNTPLPENSLKLINQYDNILNKLLTQYKPSKEVELYARTWNFIEKSKAINDIQFMHRRNGKTTPKELDNETNNATALLNNKYAICFNETPMFFCANMPKGMTLEEKMDYIYKKAEDKNLQKSIAEYLLRKYISSYNYNKDFSNGLIVLEKCVSKYNLPEKYVNDFKKRRYILDKAPFPDITFYDSEGKEHMFEEFKGYYVYIDIWASWCVPCCKEIPHLQKLEKELNNPAVKFLSVSIDQNEKNWKKKIEELNLHGNQWFNKGNEISNFLNINAIPRFLLYDKEGKLMNIDATRPSNPQTKEMLEQLK